MSVILKVSNISKQYRLGLVGLDSMRDDLKRFWHKLRGKEDPFLKVGELNERAIKGVSDYIWALQDINFEIEKGEVLGIIGKNGAGKSTLLKILSRVTSPTTGEIKTKGRIASLLEVGTGFHPELTGLENVYLNGAILGMSKAEIKAKEADIITFSGCERYIDTPVKRYSSGMTVRLAFAVAAFLEPDILIVDEVLAVGDAEFQKRAVGKMQEISKGHGRTVLFVSHNMAAVKSLCTRAIVLEHGRVVFESETDKAVQYYLDLGNKNNTSFQRFFEDISHANTNLFELISTNIRSENKKLGEPIIRDETIILECKLFKKKGIVPIHVVFRFKNEDGTYLFVSGSSLIDQPEQEIGKLIFKLIIPRCFFNEGSFYVDLMLHDGKKVIFLEDDALYFSVLQENMEIGSWMGKSKGFLKPKFNWVVKNI